MSKDKQNKNNGNIHANHRSRVRRRFLDDGLENFAPHNVLELLLFFAIPQKDTNELAHNLIEEFGSLTAVFDADYEDLLSVDGIGENTAALIKLIPQLARKYVEEKASNGLVIDDMESIKGRVAAHFIDATSEKVTLLGFDEKGRFIKACDVSLGTKTFALIDGQTLAKASFKIDAASVILAHNHPSGTARPSMEDVSMTINIISLFKSINIKFRDHMIVAGNKCFCMASSDEYSHLF